MGDASPALDSALAQNGVWVIAFPMATDKPAETASFSKKVSFQGARMEDLLGRALNNTYRMNALPGKEGMGRDWCTS